MSWSLGWKRSSEIFRITLLYDDNQADVETPSPLQIDLDWYGYEDEEQVALRLQSEITVALPPMKDSVAIEFEIEEESGVKVLIRVLKRREELKEVVMTKETGSSTVNDGCGVLRRLLRSGMDCWDCVRIVTICECGLLAVPEELTRLPLLEELYLYNNRLSQLPAELGEVKHLKVLNVDNNMLVSLPVELKQCVMLVELSLENNKLVRPLLDFRSMAELRVLRLFGNPLEFLPEILPLNNLRHLSLANIRIEATENLKSVHVEIETDNSSYFVASRHKLSNFFSLIFRFSSCHHPLLASALAQMMQDSNNHIAISKEENSIRQLISMIRSDSRHVVEQACIALSSLARDVTLAMQLIKADIMMPIEFVLRSVDHEAVISVLEVVVTLALASDNVAYRMMLVKDLMKSLKHLCAHKNVEVQRLALFAIGNLAFCLENRRILTQSQSLQELLIRLTLTTVPRVNKAAARALAILGENEKLRRAVKGKPVEKRGLRILSMDGGGMKGLATVQMLKQIEQGTGKHIHELFDLVCGTSTGGMLAVALTIKQMSLEQCEEIYKNLGKLVFTEPVSKDEAVTWREKLDQLYKSSSQRFRVVVHGSKHSADNFERLLKEMCADEDGDLLIESAVKGIPKVFVVSTLVSVTPAQPFLFRNYQYPAGTPELPLMNYEGSAIRNDTNTHTDQPGVQRRGTFMGSCKHQTWEAIRASSAAPYYLDDFSVDVNRWQDGAIVANNPTIFAIREAQLLWPDAKINCLVSIGCGEIPTKARKGGWRYLDTGQVLIESACSVERVEEALDALVPLLPDIHYYRFCPVDERFDMELDETDPAIWLKLEAATEEYIKKNSEVFKNACDRLHARNQDEDGNDANLRHPKSGSIHDDYSPSLGWRRMLLLVESWNSPYSGQSINHVRSVDTYCARNNIRMSLSNMTPGQSRLTISIPNPCASPLYTGSFPSSPLLQSPNCIPKRANSTDTVPSLSLDDQTTENIFLSLPTSPSEKWQPPSQVRSLFEKIRSLPQVGVIHFALQNDSTGSILSWRNDVFVVAEPGELADKFLRSVKQCLLSTIQSRRKKDLYSVAKISCLSELVAQRPKFEMHGVLHRYIGCQTQVMEDNREIGAYMFRRTVPDVHLTFEDVRWMVGAWRDRIIIYTGKCCPSSNLLKAFLDSGAKAIIASKTEPPNTQFITDHSLDEYSTTTNDNFVVGDEETDEDEEPESEFFSPVSAMEDGYDPFDDRYEEDLSQFICVVYDMLFRQKTTINAALQHALGLYPKLRYACHLPN